MVALGNSIPEALENCPRQGPAELLTISIWG